MAALTVDVIKIEINLYRLHSTTDQHAWLSQIRLAIEYLQYVQNKQSEKEFFGVPLAPSSVHALHMQKQEFSFAQRRLAMVLIVN